MQFYCRCCNNVYKEDHKDIIAENMEDYCHYLGYCNLKCFKKLPRAIQIDKINSARLKGDISKRRHAWYHKNIKNFK